MVSSKLRRISFQTAPFHAMLVMLAWASKTWIIAIAYADQTTFVMPSILSSSLTPMNLSTSRKWHKELSHGKTLEHVSLFCEEGGLICDENIETPSVVLHRLSSYRLSKLKEANLLTAGMFFKESEISRGNVMKLPTEEPHIPTRTFLPPILETLLFNSSRFLLPQLLLPFGFEVNSPLAKSMHETLQICRASPMEGETKGCMATFEGMFDFATSLMASTNVTILASSILPPQQLVKVVGLHEMTDEGRRVAVACHNAMFPFQVFYCHHIKGTKVFNLTLQTTTNNDIIFAIASCHPQLEASLVEIKALLHIDVEPDELICHWNHGDNIVWVPESSLLSPLITLSSQLTTTSSRS
ncbi:hypothetical protein GOP47_0024592 [Adiantum capillus-veneris]|uniref:BURP domain-containing protein n=1 Tax=Adiantum capillus-veneris TaxID=13818 RepID=A0A9D4Z4I2_ADICA|nr:hypothetical protein GOP47_0024592 [Adiantum capillus-veneris]